MADLETGFRRSSATVGGCDRQPLETLFSNSEKKKLADDEIG